MADTSIRTQASGDGPYPGIVWQHEGYASWVLPIWMRLSGMITLLGGLGLIVEGTLAWWRLSQSQQISNINGKLSERVVWCVSTRSTHNAAHGAKPMIPPPRDALGTGRNAPRTA